MTAAKVAVSIPEDSLKLARKAVRAGHAKSLSALVTTALEEKLARDELAEILNAMDKELGKPSKEARTWAKRVLSRSY